MADWEEIKRLAADFQKIQLSSTLQKLSERNCIEIISWLKEKKIIDLIFTADGKEFLTPAQLVQDIKNELYISGGRINLVELAKIIGVDLAHITTHLKDVLKGQKDIHTILGQIIDSSYISRIAGEINEKLAQQGQIDISELTIQYDLPAEFLQQQVIERNLGKIIHAKQDANDPRLFFTESFIISCKARIKGALGAITRPTSVTTILHHIEMSEKLFFTLFDQTTKYGVLTSRTISGKYTPNVYARSQHDWTTSFYRQNGYLEYDSLSRLGLSDYKSYIKKLFPNEDLVYLKSCVTSKTVLDRIEADMEECISSKSYLDVQVNLPSIFSEEDISLVIEQVLTKQRREQTVVLNNVIISKQFIDALVLDFDELIKEKAKTAVDSGKFQQYQMDQQISHKGADLEDDKSESKREERRKKAAGGKSGGGTQGRETKTKSVKKHVHSKKDAEPEVESSARSKKQIVFIAGDDVRPVVEGYLEKEGLDELTEPLVDYILVILNEKAFKLADEIYLQSVVNRNADRRQTHNELQNKLNALLGDVRLFEKGIKLLPEDAQLPLVKYLLKTLCTDVVTEILNYISAESKLTVLTDNFTHEQRLKFVGELPADLKKSLTPLVKTLVGSSVDDFMTTVEEGLKACSMIIKKIDKKKDRVIVSNHKQLLLEQLNNCEDLAMVLHLSVLVIFTTATNCMLHASGKHITSVLLFVKQYLGEEEIAELTSYHDFVILMLSGGSEAESAKEKLKEKVPNVKNIAHQFKRPGVEKH